MPQQFVIKAAEARIGEKVTVWELNDQGHRSFGQGGTVPATTR